MATIDGVEELRDAAAHRRAHERCPPVPFGGGARPPPEGPHAHDRAPEDVRGEAAAVRAGWLARLAGPAAPGVEKEGRRGG